METVDGISLARPGILSRAVFARTRSVEAEVRRAQDAEYNEPKQHHVTASGVDVAIFRGNSARQELRQSIIPVQGTQGIQLEYHQQQVDLREIDKEELRARFS